MAKKKERKAIGIQLALFADQNTEIDDNCKSVSKSMLSAAARVSNDGFCAYKIQSTNGCAMVNHIRSIDNKPVILPEENKCGVDCPYYTCKERTY